MRKQHMISIPFPKTRAKFPVNRPVSASTKVLGSGLLLLSGSLIGLHIHTKYEAKAEWAYKAGQASVTKLCTDKEALQWWTGSQDMVQVRKQLCK